MFFQYCSDTRAYLHVFPTRRSSDLKTPKWEVAIPAYLAAGGVEGFVEDSLGFYHRFDASSFSALSTGGAVDRKSTRLNSSHVKISYAVFCLKKKKESLTDK